MITQQNARKQLFGRVHAVWQAKAGAIVSPIPEVRYQGVEEGPLPGTDKFWMRVSTQNVTTNQVGHRVVEEGVSQPLYRTVGFITLQIFAPMNAPVSYAKGELLAEIGQCMFMAVELPGGIWFRNPRIRELDNDGTWYRWNVIADYQFDQVKDLEGVMLEEFFDNYNLTVAGSSDGIAIVGNELRVDIDSLPNG